MNVQDASMPRPDQAARTQCALLVEDSHHDQWLIKRALEASGRHVRLSTATTGDEAVAYLGGVGVYADLFIPSAGARSAGYQDASQIRL